MNDPETIYNWHRLDSRVTTSGQPTEAQLADIQTLGVRTVINLDFNVWTPEGVWAAFTAIRPNHP